MGLLWLRPVGISWEHPHATTIISLQACNAEPLKLGALAPEEPQGHGEAPFSKSHPILQAREAVSKEMLWFLF